MMDEKEKELLMDMLRKLSRAIDRKSTLGVRRQAYTLEGFFAKTLSSEIAGELSHNLEMVKEAAVYSEWYKALREWENIVYTLEYKAGVKVDLGAVI